MSEVVSNIGKSPGQMDTASGRRLGHVPTLTSQWWMLAEAVVQHDHDNPGIYELGDASGVVVRRQLKCHQKTPARTPRRIDDELHQAVPWGTSSPCSASPRPHRAQASAAG